MTEAAIREFVSHYELYEVSNGRSVPMDPTFRKRRSLEDARKDFAYVEYYDFGPSRLLGRKQVPRGLRNIGNTCYFNMFVQLLYSINCLRDTFLQAQPEFVKDPLSSELQLLFAKLNLSKFAYTDPTGVFDALNRMSVQGIQLGDQCDFYEYFSLALDTLEKCLAKQHALAGRDKLLQKVFYGSITQQLINGKDNPTTSTKFSIINLDVKTQSLERGFEAFRNYTVEGYKSSSGVNTQATVKSELTSFPGVMIFSVNRVRIENSQLDKDNSKFTFPTHLTFDRNSNTFIEQLSKGEDEVEKQIQALQKTISQGRSQAYLESLRKTIQFLDLQEQTTPSGTQFLAFPMEADTAATKKLLRSYISRLQKNEAAMRQMLRQLEEQKYQRTASKDFRNYSLMAVMIHDGNANGGHYFLFIHNEKTQKWHRYSDREVTPVSREEVQQTALGLLKPDMNVSCLVYKSNEIKCDPTAEANISPKVRSFVREDDEHISQQIDRIRLDRMLRNSAELARQQVETRKDALKHDPLAFALYFADPSFHFIGAGMQLKAELFRLRRFIQDPSFAEELKLNKLSETSIVSIPKIEMGADTDYCRVIEALKIALNEECKLNMVRALTFLAVRRSLKFQVPLVRDMLDSVLHLFLLKGCFYVDLMMQKNQKIGQLYELIKFVNKSLPDCLLTRQVCQNLAHSLNSVGMKYTDKVIQLKLTEAVFDKVPPVDYVDIERVFNTRFALWMGFHKEILLTKTTIRQERRQQEELLQLVQYAST